MKHLLINDSGKLDGLRGPRRLCCLVEYNETDVMSAAKDREGWRLTVS